MRNRLWILGIVLGVVVLASVLYFGSDYDTQTTPEEYVPTPTNALPNNPDSYLRTVSPTPTESPTPTPVVPATESTIKEEFVIGDRTSQALTFDGILEVDFRQRDYSRLEDYRLEVTDGTWDNVYEIPSVCTAVRLRFSGISVFEQLGAVKEETTDYYSYFNGNSLKKDDTPVMISVPIDRDTDMLEIFLRSDEALIMQNGKILASFRIKDKEIRCQLATQGLQETDYSRTYFVADDGRIENLYVEESDGQKYCYDRLTHILQWQFLSYHEGEREYRLEVRNPRAPEDRNDMSVLYRGAPDTLPTEVYGITNTAFSLWDRILEAENGAKVASREWEKTKHTSILETGSYGTLYMDTIFCSYIAENEEGNEGITATIMERVFRWENPDTHMSMEVVVPDADCAIDVRTVIDDPEYPRYLLRSYNVSDRKTRSRAETTEEKLLWVEEAMIADGEPYRVTRTYPDTEYIRIQDFSHGQLHSEEITDFAGKRIRISYFTYNENDMIERTETRDKDDNLIETFDYIYDVSGDLVKSMKKTYDKDGTPIESVSYDADGNVLPEEPVVPPADITD
ncbi:MAG: hypothetical protein J6Y10_09270 [Lachnospiraceae bacterium]|nr:hypothetical protein [Lachnospiraceae bacterium]